MQDTFDTVVKRFRGQIYSFAQYYLRNSAEAEDATQDVLVKLWKNWQSLSDKQVQPWIIKVTRTTCIDALRKRRTRQTLTSNGFNEETTHDLAANTPDPAEVTEMRDFRAQCEKALAEIPDPQRSILILREIHDLKYDDICAALDLPMSTVKVYLFRGRKALREKVRKAMQYENSRSKR